MLRVVSCWGNSMSIPERHLCCGVCPGVFRFRTRMTHGRCGASGRLVSCPVAWCSYEGGVLHTHPDPWPVFRGKPHVVRYDDEGARRGPEQGPPLVRVRGRRSRSIGTLLRPGQLQVFEDDERIGRFRFILVSHTQVSGSCRVRRPRMRVSSSLAGVSRIWPSSRTEPRWSISEDCSSHAITLQVLSTPPKDVLVHLRWPESPRELRVWVPFPASSGRAFDVEGTPVVSGVSCPCGMPQACASSYSIRTPTSRKSMRSSSG